MTLWTRIRDAIALPFRRAPREGRWLEKAKTALTGFVAFRPFALPRRHYRLYVPRGGSRFRRAPLIVLCHGCRQTAEEFAQGTGIAQVADALGALVLMPRQSTIANPYGCWNWFDARTSSGKGEAAIVAAMIRSVRRWRRVDRSRVVVAGMSAGGALAAVMGVRHPELVRGVFVHSGLACGAARGAFTALTVMRRGPEQDVAAIARDASASAPVPLLAVQGDVDDVVAPMHAAALARQYLALDGVAVPPGAESTLPPPDDDRRDHSDAARPLRMRTWRREGRDIVTLATIGGLGHAWSGGDGALPFNDPQGPSATALLADWLRALPE